MVQVHTFHVLSRPVKEIFSNTNVTTICATLKLRMAPDFSVYIHLTTKAIDLYQCPLEGFELQDMAKHEASAPYGVNSNIFWTCF